MPRSTRSPCRKPPRNSATALLLTAALGGGGEGARAADPCTDVQVGSAQSYACLNRGLQRTVEQSRAPVQGPSVTAQSAPPRTGTYNQAGTREYLGANFGRSAHPARPPPIPILGPHL